MPDLLFLLRLGARGLLLWETDPEGWASPPWQGAEWPWQGGRKEQALGQAARKPQALQHFLAGGRLGKEQGVPRQHGKDRKGVDGGRKNSLLS